MQTEIIFRQELINNIYHTFVVGSWPKEIIIANSLLNEPSSLFQVNTTSIIINVENGSAEYRPIKTDVIKQYCVYKLVESILINN